MENVEPDARQLQKYTAPGLARHVLWLAYGATFFASKNGRQKLDADEVITWSSPTVTLLSLLKAGLDAQRGNAGTITSAREQPGGREIATLSLKKLPRCH